MGFARKSFLKDKKKFLGTPIEFAGVKLNIHRHYRQILKVRI